ncbi:MAG: hypothetical protein WDO70_05720 [Alphaproteobacteria bacterium]
MDDAFNKKISTLSQYFLEQAQEAFVEIGGRRVVSPKQYDPPQWKKLPGAAITAAFKDSEEWHTVPSGALGSIRRDRPRFTRQFKNWLTTRDITELAFLARGTTAVVFRAKHADDVASGSPVQDTVVRLGPTSKHYTIEFDRAWCPLVTQADAQGIFSSRYDTDKVRGEDLPFLPLDYGYNATMRGFPSVVRRILQDTPYELSKGDDDLAIFSDGTPVYVDPDCLNFRDTETARQHARLQFDPQWQQSIMATIDKNCREIGWPEALSWVVKGEGGLYRTKQDVLYKPPGMPSRPNPAPLHAAQKHVL